MKPFSGLRKLGSSRKSPTDQATGSSYRPSLSASKKTYAKVFAVGLLVSSILILAPTVFLSGGPPQKQIIVGGGGSTASGLKPTYSRAVAFVETPAVRDLKFETPTAEETNKLIENRSEREKNQENSERVKPVPDPKKNGPFIDPGINNFKHPDPQTNTVTNPIVNFLGPDADAGEPLYGTRFIPPDTNAAVGPNHIIAISNMGLRIYDKSGNPLTAQFRLSTLLVGIPNAGDDDGDPVVLYDQLADRWILSQFNLTVTANSTHQHIAVSKTGDPTGAYYAYDFLMTANRPADYPHMGVWHDGYYMSTNDFSLPVFSNPFQGAGLYAFERNKMLVGDPSALIIRFNTNNMHGGMLPTNLQGFTPAPAGTPNLFYEFDADEFGAATDLVRTFAFHADFATPANSTLTQGPDIPTTPFDARTNRMQEPPPGEDLDGLNDRLMHAVNFRVLAGGVQSYVLNFTVNVSGVNPTTPALYQGGVRWMEMRRNAGTGVVSINQQATYAPGSGSGVGRDVWMGAIAQDGEGNIGLGMSASAPGPTPAALNPTALYTGRLAGDPVNTLPQGEVDALSAVTRGIQLSNSFNRWGDYSSLFIDPADDCTFWGAFEYVDSPNATFDWNERIFSFKVNPTCVTSPRGTINGTITNCSGGTPIPNAVITTPDGFFRQSNASGQFSITVPPGTYTVTVTGPPASGFGNCTQMVTVAANGTATVNCCLAAAAIITSGGATLVSESCAPANGAIDPGETVTVSLCVQNTGASNTTALMGTLQATGGVTNIQPPNPQNYGVVVAGGPAVCRNFTFTANGACGGTITATVHFVDGATDLGNVTYTFSLGAAGAPLTFSFTGPAVTIPDSVAAGVNIPIVVTGAGTISDLNFRIDGSSCNTNNPSLTVGVDHSWVGDLKFTLTNPGNTTSVVLMNRPGGGTFGSSGNNFCQTLLDDDGAFPSIQSIASTGAPPAGPPYTGTFTPASPLSAFDGQPADGTWMLNVSDNAAGDTGFVRAFSLIFTPLACSTSCATPCVITCPANITKSNDPNQCGAVVTYPAPTTTGSCGTVTCTPPSGSFFPVGTTTVTCQAVDNGGGTAATPKAPKGAPGCTTITESTSQAIVDNNSVSCNNGIGHTDNSYWRAFTLSSFGINNAFDVQSVDVGIELASAGVAGVSAAGPNISKQKKVGSHAPNGGGSQPITVNIYTSSSPFPTGFPGSLTLIGTTSTTIADQSDTIINVPVTGTAPPGSQLVVEVFTPDGEAAGNLIFIGSNTAAETGPSYLSAAACGVATPTTTAALGFPDMHIVMNVNGCEQVQGNGPTCTFTVTVNDTQPPVITCPPNQTAVTPNVNSPCAVVNFTTTASDNCPGVTVVCNPPSGSCFPIGVTTVTCTATDAHSNTATCSFTVSVFNGRLEDDSESCNDSVLFNTLTGDYRWCCHGTTFTGRGKVTRSGDTIALSHVAADRRVLINLAAGAPTPTGNGSLQFPAGTTRCVLSDRDIRNDTCLCGNAPPPSSKK